MAARSGQGALRVAGKTASYHRMTEGSVGLLAGAQSQAVFILFMTDDALNRFSFQQWLDRRRRRFGVT